jgi:uncharacterized protein YlaI
VSRINDFFASVDSTTKKRCTLCSEVYPLVKEHWAVYHYKGEPRVKSLCRECINRTNRASRKLRQRIKAGQVIPGADLYGNDACGCCGFVVKRRYTVEVKGVAYNVCNDCRIGINSGLERAKETWFSYREHILDEERQDFEWQKKGLERPPHAETEYNVTFPHKYCHLYSKIYEHIVQLLS